MNDKQRQQHSFLHSVHILRIPIRLQGNMLKKIFNQFHFSHSQLVLADTL